jgi:hypothetical protein
MMMSVRDALSVIAHTVKSCWWLTTVTFGGIIACMSDTQNTQREMSRKKGGG